MLLSEVRMPCHGIQAGMTPDDCAGVSCAGFTGYRHLNINHWVANVARCECRWMQLSGRKSKTQMPLDAMVIVHSIRFLT